MHDVLLVRDNVRHRVLSIKIAGENHQQHQPTLRPICMSIFFFRVVARTGAAYRGFGVGGMVAHMALSPVPFFTSALNAVRTRVAQKMCPKYIPYKGWSRRTRIAPEFIGHLLA
jgi:hypothetical protein